MTTKSLTTFISSLSGSVLLGTGNTVDELSVYSSLVGGENNNIPIDSSHSFIGGGSDNTNQSVYGFLGGGENNYCMGYDGEGGAYYQVLCGGYVNICHSDFSIVVGGYVVIERGSYRKDTATVICTASIYKDIASRDAKQPPISHYRFSYNYDVNGGEMITQAYNALKQEGAMAGSIDV